MERLDSLKIGKVILERNILWACNRLLDLYPNLSVNKTIVSYGFKYREYFFNLSNEQWVRKANPFLNLPLN